MSAFLDSIKAKAKADKKTIVLPESMDRRTFEAAAVVLKEDLADLIILGNPEDIAKNSEGLDVSKAQFIDPKTSDKLDGFVDLLVELRKKKGLTPEDARKLLTTDNMYFACMMVKTEVFRKIGGFEEKLAVAFNDVDLCLRIREAGYLIVYDPYVQICHLESRTRGAEDSEEKVRRFQSEIEFFRTRWIDILKKGDPYYNKNLSLTKWNYSLRALPGMAEK